MKIFTSLILSFLAINSFASDAKVTTAFKIESLRVSESTGITYIDPIGDVAVKNSSCASDDLYAIKNSPDSTTYDAMYSTFLAAALSGKDIKVWVSVDNGDCHNNRQRITVVEIIL